MGRICEMTEIYEMADETACVCTERTVRVSNKGLKNPNQPPPMPAGFCAAAWSIRVVLEVLEVVDDARVGVTIVKSMAIVRPPHDDTRMSAGRSSPGCYPSTRT